MRFLPLLLLALVCACAREHATEAVEVRGTDCVTCHLAQYQSANPPHVGNFPQTCADCHSTSSWIPALGGAHPEASFPIASGAHQGITCQDCHDSSKGTSVGGANTDCIGCHTGEHSQTRMANAHGGVSRYMWDATMPHFCLSCHPSGRAN